MKSQGDIHIRIRVSGFLLAGIVALGLFVVALVSETGAQQQPRDVNTIAAETEPTPLASTPVSFPEPPEGFQWTVNGELVPMEATVAKSTSESASSRAPSAAGSGGMFYLTNANVASDKALTECAPGYHMASLWEIIDPSNLTYNYNHPDAHTKADSGQGPPSLWNGRVRTGTISSGLNTAGTGNCDNWTSTSSNDYGTFVRLERSWETPPDEIGGIWDATAFACNFTGPVWCVED